MSKIALVTGASRGLGKDMAVSLAKNEIDVILTYHSKKEEAEDVASEIKAMGRKAAVLQLDIADTKSFDGFLQKVKQVLDQNWNQQSFDFLINNAGTGATVFIPDVTETLFDQFVNMHYKGPYFLTQKAIPMIIDGGAVIFISSGTTRFSVPGYSVYSSMKAALEIFTRHVAREYGKRGIRSNIVAPGPIETDFNNAAIRSNPDRKAFLASQSPLNRVGQPDDIGGVVAFLCSDAAKWINGQRVEV